MLVDQASALPTMSGIGAPTTLKGSSLPCSRRKLKGHGGPAAPGALDREIDINRLTEATLRLLGVRYFVSDQDPISRVSSSIPSFDWSDRHSPIRVFELLNAAPAGVGQAKLSWLRGPEHRVFVRSTGGHVYLSEQPVTGWKVDGGRNLQRPMAVAWGAAGGTSSEGNTRESFALRRQGDRGPWISLVALGDSCGCPSFRKLESTTTKNISCRMRNCQWRPGHSGWSELMILVDRPPTVPGFRAGKEKLNTTTAWQN